MKLMGYPVCRTVITSPLRENYPWMVPWSFYPDSLKQHRHHKNMTVRCVHTSTCENENVRRNPVKIQLLPEGLSKQVFKDKADASLTVSSEILSKVMKHLEHFDLANKTTANLSPVDFKLPPLLGNSVGDHFQTIALQQTAPYKALLGQLLGMKSMPKLPRSWRKAAGWTKYDPVSGKACSVNYPEERALVFDIETLVCDGPYPTMATALSPKAWFVLIEIRWNLSWKNTLSDIKMWFLKSLVTHTSIVLTCKTFCLKYVSFKTGGLTAMVSQDRFHCMIPVIVLPLSLWEL